MSLIRHIPFLKAVFFYSISAFGGPQAHLGMMTNSFTGKRKDLTEKELIDIYSFCQLLPGATSTQTLTLIGYKRGGVLLALLTLVIWIMPAVLLMTLLSFFVSGDSGNILQIFRHLQPMALGFLAFASLKTFRLVHTLRQQIIVAIVATITFLFFKSPWVFPIMMILGSLSGFIIKEDQDAPVNEKKRKLNWSLFAFFTFFFLLAATLSETARKQDWPNRTPYNLFENMYRFGSFVLGGADVLIPVMYEQYVVRPETERVRTNNQNAIRIERETFLTAAGVVRAVPGPAFSISAFVGGIAMQHKHPAQQIMGAVIAAVGIFLPSFLIGVFFFPFWENLHRYKLAKRLMLGINTAVVGIMFASIFFLTQDTIAPLQNAQIVDAVIFFSVMSATFFLLRLTKIAPPFIALGCLLLGLLDYWV